MSQSAGPSCGHLELDVHSADVICQPFFQELDELPGVAAVESDHRVALPHIGEDLREAIVGLSVLLGDRTAVPCHAPFLEAKVGAGVVLEAGKAFLEGINLPKYDDQKLIYDDILKELQEGTKALDAGKAIEAGDLVALPRARGLALLGRMSSLFELLGELGPLLDKHSPDPEEQV